MKIRLFVLLLMCAGLSACILKKQFGHDSGKLTLRAAETEQGLLTGADLAALPDVVQRYIRRSGSLNKPKINSFRVTCEGKLRGDSAKGWMRMRSTQYNPVPAPERFFFLNATMKGMPVRGYHRFKEGHATMDIRLFSLFKVQYQEGPEMDTAETVTFFNDLCLMAPGALADERIRWYPGEGLSVEAAFTSNGITVSARLIFNEKDELVNFISDDRYVLDTDNTIKRMRWSTPVTTYRLMNGYLLPAEARAVWSYPWGDYCYASLAIKDVVYNPQK